MAVFLKCPRCAQVHRVTDEVAARLFACVACGQELEIAAAQQVRAPHGADVRDNVATAGLFSLVDQSTPFLKQILAHIEQTIGTPPMAFHEVLPNDEPLDLHIVPPVAGEAASDRHPHGRNFYTIVTSGLSARGANVAAGLPGYAELMISLPAGWPGLRMDGMLDQAVIQQEANWWPLRCLKTAAAMSPQSGFMSGVIIPDGPAPFTANTRLAGMLLMPSVLHPDASLLPIDGEAAVAFYAMWPLYPEEIVLARDQGVGKLIALLRASHITDLIDLKRGNTASK